MRVLLPHGEFPAALATARCLAAAGHDVAVGDHKRAVVARFSRAVTRFVALPPPGRDPTAFCAAVVDEARTFGADAVLPIFDEGMILGGLWPTSCKVRLVAPSWEQASELADKWMAWERCRASSMSFAPTMMATESAAAIARDLGLPAVLKPRWAASGYGVQVASTSADLARALAGIADRSAFVAQRWAGRQPWVFQGLFDQGRCVAAHAYRVLCRHPPEHGFGILLESTTEPEILGVGIRLGDRLGYHGLLGVDFLNEPGRPARIVEINPRMVLGVVNAVDSGVPLPALALTLDLERHGDVAAKTPGYRAGVQTLHWPSRSVSRATGESLTRQFIRWGRSHLHDPGALAAFFGTILAYRRSGGVDAESINVDRALSLDVVRQIQRARSHAL